ncbi:AraC family transcriptional regulator [Paenibacillus sp. HJGM_3]|uniref:AraC family transcriptional regulator n=1 Tax=Paenibacillus sp. HJGM_3 TaxID=3379816 RepID=UPI00385EE64B
MYEGDRYETMWMPNMELGIRIYESHWRKTLVPWWTHQISFPIFELNVLLEGIQEVRIGNHEYRMTAGDILLVRPGLQRQVLGTRGRPIIYFALHFDVEDYELRSILSQSLCGLHPKDSPLERELRHPLGQLIETMRSDGGPRERSHPSLRMKLVSHLFVLFAVMGSMERERALPDAGTLIAYRLAERIERGVREGRFGAEPSRGAIGRITEELGYSSSYCYRMFRRTFHVSPQTYMSNLVLHRCRLELDEPGQSLEQIAAKLGFQDGLHFSKQFKRWTGSSPTEYRRSRAVAGSEGGL